MCSLMGMACALTIVLFGWVLLLRVRGGGVLHLLARLLALAAHVARRYSGAAAAVTFARCRSFESDSTPAGPPTSGSTRMPRTRAGIRQPAPI